MIPTSSQLAILGGQPCFEEPLHVGRPNLGDRDQFLQRVDEMLDRRWFTNDGPLVREFEERIKDHLGVQHCIATCNATVGLAIAVRALDLQGEVILPAYTFVSTAHVLRWQQIKPVFADIDPATHNLCPTAVEKAITARTSAIIGVHVWGRACDTVRMEALAESRRIPVLYDAAHAFGCSHLGVMLGSFGKCEVFSFHATKFLNSFEGGAITTNDSEFAAKLRLMRNFGFQGYDRVLEIGTNGKMSEVCAAMGITSLEAVGDLISHNRSNCRLYSVHLAGIAGVSLIQYSPSDKNNFQYVIAEIDPNVCPLDRDELVETLHAENVLARKYFWPGCHRMEPYATEQPEAALMLPWTEQIAARVIVLPTGQSVGEDEIRQICRIIRDAIGQARDIRARLQARKHPAES